MAHPFRFKPAKDGILIEWGDDPLDFIILGYEQFSELSMIMTNIEDGHFDPRDKRGEDYW